MSEIKKKKTVEKVPTMPKLDQVQELVNYMASMNVTSFKVGEIEVVFSPDRSMPAAMTLEPEEEKQRQLEEIRLRLAAMNDDADADLNWST